MARRLKDEDRRLWRDAMRGVKPLSHGAAEPPLAAAPEPTPALSDGPSVVTRRIASDTSAAAPPLDRRTFARLRRGDLAIDARLDLHGLTQAAAHRALAQFVAEAAADGARLVLVITGKGRSGEGVLRAAVPRWLAEPALRSHVLATTPAPPNLGGSGALCVRLRRPRP
jgi:DNA-nicking Smr family endonuclease